jgi:hypothetical protein
VPVSRFTSLSEALDLLVEPVTVRNEWGEIVREAHGHRRLTSPRPRLSRSVIVLAAVVLVVGLSAAAFASGFAGRFSAWIGGKPGVPASSSDQQGFDLRNSRVLASFPAGTKLRLLLAHRVDGREFDLLGFRNGDTYCLRLILADLPSGRGSNQCLRNVELNGHVALVANDVDFRVGKPGMAISGIYGFASDAVSGLRVTRTRGVTTVPVSNNVFLSLHGQPEGTVQRHPAADDVLSVSAFLRNGGARNVPYVVQGIGQGILPGGKQPSVPSYFAPPGTTVVPDAPSKVVAPILHPTIAWLTRHEKRGQPLPAEHLGHIIFGRVIHPDPDNPSRLGVALGPASGMSHGRPLKGIWTCLIDFEPFSSGGGLSCFPPFQRGVIDVGSWYDSPIVDFTGLAADGIVRIEAFLGNGTRVAAALRDNAFSVSFPQTELPAELVGYNRQGQVAGITKLPGNGTIQPCPTAKFVTPTNQLPASQPWERIDLADLTVNGQPILGKTPDEVRAILGTPSMIRPVEQKKHVTIIPEYRYGGTTQATLGLSIQFARHGKLIEASRLFFQAPSLTDAKLGHLLRMQPTQLQQLVGSTLGNRYRRTLSYDNNQFTCTGSFQQRGGAAGFSFGIDPYRPSRPYLQIAANIGG